MSFRPQKSPQGSGKLSKTAQEKKTKEKKQRQAAKHFQEETPQISPKEVTERTLSSVNRLGNQIFALSPFSQYFDDWLVNLRQVVSEFETNPAINADELFQKERAQIFSDVEAALAENRLAESNLTEEARALEENNHKIADADKEYAEKNREINNKRNAEIQKLTNTIHQLEDDLAAQQQVKLGFFKFKEKKLAAERVDQTAKELKAAKNEFEVKTESFKVEQEKLHDNYELRKQELSATSDQLHKELEKLETDTSTEARQKACNALTQSINAQLSRLPAT
ncbi:MAG TPA: hypothetical protein VLH35_02465 [Candidatus Acidoferrales bacterium]|nr:hypothetical protein [Candidatus Acidoferrales bacterium]